MEPASRCSYNFLATVYRLRGNTSGHSLYEEQGEKGETVGIDTERAQVPPRRVAAFSLSSFSLSLFSRS